MYCTVLSAAGLRKSRRVEITNVTIEFGAGDLTGKLLYGEASNNLAGLSNTKPSADHRASFKTASANQVPVCQGKKQQIIPPTRT